MSKSKPIFGNVSVPKPLQTTAQQESLKAASIFSDLDTELSDNFIPSYARPSSKVSDFFANQSSQPSFTAYDIQTGLDSDKPEIVSLIDFLPVYSDNGELNDFGYLLQSKQDSNLISAKSSVDSVLNNEQFKKIEDQIKNNKKQIRTFLSNYTQNIDDLLSSIETIKKKMDFRYPFDQQILDQFGYGLNSSNTFGKPVEIKEILLEEKTVYGQWTTSKSWIQACLKIKDMLREGMPINTDTNIIQNIDLYKDPYSIVTTFSANSNKKFSYNESIVGLAKNDFFANIPDIPVDTTSFLSPAEIEGTLSDLKKFLSTGLGSIFTDSFVSPAENINKSISKLSFLISREYLYTFNCLYVWQPPSLLNIVYPFSATGENSFKDFWDYIVGRSGKDITDIQSNPAGNGNSLISACQSIEANNTQVLTFEDQYIFDNVGSKKGSVITPGIFFYLESSLNSEASGFSTSRISSLIDRINRTLQITNFVYEKMLFNDSFVPYRSTKERIEKISFSSALNDFSGDDDSVDALDIHKKNAHLKNPISLIREIEKRILSNSYLTIRNPQPPIAEVEISAVLISAAIESFLDGKSDLLCLLFILMKIYLDESVASPVSQDQIASQIKNQLNILFGNSDTDNFIHTIKDIFDNSKTSNLSILRNIGDFLKDVHSAPVDEQLSYSGINKTIYCFSLFLLCCLVTHAANPDRIKGFKSWYGTTFTLKIERSYNPVFTNNVPGTNNVIQTFETGQSSYNFKALVFDEVLNSSEKILFSYMSKNASFLNSFRVFLNTLATNLQSFKSKLESGIYLNFLNSTKQIVSDPNKVRQLMTKDQLKLILSLSKDLLERCNEDYVSPVKTIFPYFDSLKSNSSVENLLPIQDVPLVSWNLFLKNQLKAPRFRESSALNLKIVSVGIPQQLFRRIQIDANDLAGSTSRNNIIKINLYREDYLRRNLIHKPLTFLFDLRRYATRKLSNYQTATDVLNGKSNLSIFPFLEYDSGEMKQFDYFSGDLNFLGPSDIAKVRDNHQLSLIAEEYFQFISDISFSETNINEYGLLSETTQVKFDDFMINAIGQVPANINPSCKNFFSKNTLLFDNFNNFMRKILLPRKFDRIFHIMFDPDDFEVYESPVVASYVDQGIVEIKNGVYKRTTTTKDQVYFDKYSVTLETYSSPNISL